MRIAKGQTLAGIPLIEIRDALRTVKDRHFNADSLEHRLGLSPDQAMALLEALHEAGYVEPARSSADEGRWQLTLHGGALTNATAAKPVKRETAKRAVDGLLERAHQINSEGKFAFWVDTVILFGSYLTSDAPTVGDVDVAIGLSSRAGDGDARIRLAEERIEAAKKDGRYFNTFVDELAWPEMEVYRFLKSRSRTLSLTRADDKVLEQAPHQVIYRRPGAHTSDAD